MPPPKNNNNNNNREHTNNPVIPLFQQWRFVTDPDVDEAQQFREPALSDQPGLPEVFVREDALAQVIMCGDYRSPSSSSMCFLTISSRPPFTSFPIN